MHGTKIVILKKPKLKNPIFIEGLPGIGNVGRIAAGYLAEELGAEKFAELYSSHFMPFVLLHQSSEVHMLKNEFFFWKAKKRGQRDLIILIGDSQSVDPVGHYEIVETVLDFIEKFGTKEIITLAGLNVGRVVEKPRVVGAVTHEELIEKYSKFGIDFEAGSRVGTIVGASGLFLGLGKVRGMKGICLLGETSGFPIVPDPKAAKTVLNVLLKILNVSIDTSKLERKVEEMKRFMKKIEKVQKKALQQLMETRKPVREEELKYIG
ncbi:MAG TPA: proteasome assembly chaperone family protein [Candidatus Aenigmarchaeota archaeon]|nr:proteasome assembly chaperone family protein [Candidatus Aenigmarchaeota archaeon]